jgi:hypothetical protein
MVRLCILISVLFLHGYPALSQKIKTEGYLIYTLGVDTPMIGSYKLKGKDFELTVLSREYATVYKQKGNFYNNGELKAVEGYSYLVEYGKEPQNKRTYKLYVKDDSTHTEISTGENNRSFVYKGKGIVNNMIGHTTFFLLPFWTRYSPPVRDSFTSQHMWWSKPKTYVIKRPDQKTMRVGSTLMGFLTLDLDDRGNLKSINGIGSSLNVIGHVFPYRDMDSTIKAFALREHLSGSIGPNNKSDSVIASINSTNVKIYYNKPSMRGRQIFGSVVPYNRFWRTGANQATLFRIDKPIYFNEKELPAGRYSIFTLPKEEGWTLMFNKDVGIWGTDYDPNHDALRVPMKVESLNEPVELMTIDIRPIDGGGVLTIRWERKMASVFFTTQ